MIRSPLRYPGGKFKAMPQIMPHIPANVKDWREPFFGGGSVTLYYLQECMAHSLHEVTGEIRQMPTSITVGDLNPEIYHFWVGCKDYPVESIVEALKQYAKFNKTFILGYIGYADYIDAEMLNINDERVINSARRYSESVDELNKIVIEAKNECVSNAKKIFEENGCEYSIDEYRYMLNVLVNTRGDGLETCKEMGDNMLSPRVKTAMSLWKAVYEDMTAMFDWLKNVDCTGMSTASRSARQFLINRISFSGMGDAGSISKDQYMAYRTSDAMRLISVSSLLQDVEIRNCSFEEIMKLEPINCSAEDVYIFLDPPYLTQESSGLYGKDGNMHHGFPHQMFVDECRKSPYKFLVTYDDSLQVRRMFRGMKIKPYKLTYTMAGKTSEDALGGEELFIANFSLDTNTGDNKYTL